MTDGVGIFEGLCGVDEKLYKDRGGGYGSNTAGSRKFLADSHMLD